MKNIKTIGNQWASLLGVQGVIGVGLILFAAGFYDSSIQPRLERVTQLRAKTERLQQKAGAVAETAREPGPLADFYAFFPAFSTVPQGLGKLYALAEHEGLDLAKGGYHLTTEPQGQLVAYQAVFPLRGTYLQLRRFVVAMLYDLPNVSLDDLRLEKQSTADTAVDSKITLTFYLRAK